MSPRLAALPMYDFPEMAEANDQLWAAIAQRLQAAGVTDAPARLTRDMPLEALWTEPSLLLAQTCGYPFAKFLRGEVKLVATPRYRAIGCSGPFHRSVIVVRAADAAKQLTDLRGARLAVNEETSGSGMNALRALLAPLAGGKPFFSQVTLTGSHAASAEAVAGGAADVTAIDCVTWAHLERWRPNLTRGLRILVWSARSPGLPLITAGRSDPRTVAALVYALTDVSLDPALAEVRRALLLEGFSELPEAYYLTGLSWEKTAAALDYPTLC